MAISYKKTQLVKTIMIGIQIQKIFTDQSTKFNSKDKFTLSGLTDVEYEKENSKVNKILNISHVTKNTHLLLH